MEEEANPARWEAFDERKKGRAENLERGMGGETTQEKDSSYKTVGSREGELRLG